MTTKIFQKNRFKMFLIVVGSVFLTALLHQVFADPVLDVSKFPPSGAVEMIGSFIPLLLVSLFFVYSIIGYTFLKIHEMIPAPKNRKWLIYGIATGGLWVVGMIEMTPWTNTPFLLEVWAGLADFAGILLMCFLLGKTIASNLSDYQETKRNLFPAILIIPVMYILGRYFSYIILNIDSGYNVHAIGTFLWTAGMGTWIWVMYYLLGVDIWAATPIKKSIVFGGVIFGLIWTLLDGIGCLISSYFKMSDSIIRTVFDMLVIMIAVYISSVLTAKNTD